MLGKIIILSGPVSLIVDEVYLSDKFLIGKQQETYP